MAEDTHARTHREVDWRPLVELDVFSIMFLILTGETCAHHSVSLITFQLFSRVLHPLPCAP
ncbi:MAG: hypothetical protein EBR20_03770 [Bacteroidetes bacterium]|nr:hypothetical protein [Bacteroidota bacterium]